MDTSPTPGSPRRRGAGRRSRTDAVWTVETYAAQVLRTAVRLAGRRNGAFDADDIGQRVVERFLRNPESIMVRYPNPDVFASVTFGGEGVDFARRERAQRCQGVAGDRTVVSWDAVVESGHDLRASAHDPATEAVAAVVVERVLAGLGDTDRYIAVAHWINGDKVGEIAVAIGRNHATVSRRLRAMSVLLQEALGDDGYVLAT